MMLDELRKDNNRLTGGTERKDRRVETKRRRREEARKVGK